MKLEKQGRWGLACDSGFSNYSTCCVSGVTDSFMATCGETTSSSNTYTVCTSFYSDKSCGSSVSKTCTDVTTACSDLLSLKISDYQSICSNITSYGQCCNSISIFGINSAQVTCGQKSTSTSVSSALNTIVALTIPTILAFLTYFRIW